MKVKEIKALLDKYFEGETTLEEERWLEDYFSTQEVDPTLTAYQDEFIYFMKQRDKDKDLAFSKLMFPHDDIKSPEKTSTAKWAFVSIAASVALICGVLIGRFLWLPPDYVNSDLEELRTEIRINEQLILSKFKEVAAKERIVGVAYINEISSINDELMEALISLIKNDANLNVKLAAVDALIPYAHEKDVHAVLLELLSDEKSPAVQIALVNALLLFDKNLLRDELEVLLNNQNLMPELKEAFVNSVSN